MCIGADGELTFWDWLAAEEESSTSAWDCGLLEISTDLGATWENLAPVGGYSHTKNSNPANPLPEGTPCWSGFHDWRQETFDLSAYAGEHITLRLELVPEVPLGRSDLTWWGSPRIAGPAPGGAGPETREE